MNILAAIRREERKIEKQLGKLQGQLENLRTAGKALANSANHQMGGVSRFPDVVPVVPKLEHSLVTENAA